MLLLRLRYAHWLLLRLLNHLLRLLRLLNHLLRLLRLLNHYGVPCSSCVLRHHLDLLPPLSQVILQLLLSQRMRDL
jgi:hypothetical protein